MRGVGHLRRVMVAAIALATASSAPAFAQTGTAFDFHVERLVASPTPAGPVLLLSDAATWDLTLATPAIVWIDARATGGSLFLLTTDCGPLGVSAPASHDVRICSRPGTWKIQVDPAAGVAVDILVRFRGYTHDVGGAPAAFALEGTSAPDATRCVVTGVCLP